MMLEYPEYDYVIVRRPGWTANDLRAVDMVEALGLCGIWPHRRRLVEDRGDRVRLHDDERRSRGRDFIFLLNGEVHIPAHEVIAIFFANIPVEGENGLRAVSNRPWSRHGRRWPRPRTGSERRANARDTAEDAAAEAGVRIRPCRRLALDPWDEPVRRTQRTWKSFRKTRWRVNRDGG